MASMARVRWEDCPVAPHDDARRHWAAVTLQARCRGLLVRLALAHFFRLMGCPVAQRRRFALQAAKTSSYGDGIRRLFLGLSMMRR